MYWCILYSLITATFQNYSCYLYFCTFPWGLLCFSDSLSMGGNNYSKLGAYNRVTSRGLVSRLQTWSATRRSSVTTACETQRKKTVSKEKHFQLNYEIIMRYSLPLKSVSQTFLCKVASVCFVFSSSICNADFHGSLVNSQNIGP